MKELLIIFGTSEFSEYVFQTIKKEGIVKVIGFTVDKEHLSKNEFNHLPVFAFEDLPKLIDISSCGILITVGYTKMNQVRKEVYRKCKALGYKVATYISSRAICDSDSIGEGCLVMPMAYIPPITTLGICSVVNTATILGHTSHIGDFNWFAGNVVTGGNVRVDNNCFLGMNSLVKNGIHVASKTMIGAYSYLSEDTMENKFYSGTPAINVKKLNADVVCDFI